MESEVVLECEGNNNEGACAHVVLDVKNDCFVRNNASCGLDDTSLEPSATREKITCAGVRRMRGYGVVCTPSIAHTGNRQCL